MYRLEYLFRLIVWERDKRLLFQLTFKSFAADDRHPAGKVLADIRCRLVVDHLHALDKRKSFREVLLVSAVVGEQDYHVRIIGPECSREHRPGIFPAPDSGYHHLGMFAPGVIKGA